MTLSEGAMLLLFVIVMTLTASVAFGVEVHPLIVHIGHALDSATAASR